MVILVIVYWRIYSITKHHLRQRFKKTEQIEKKLRQFAAATRKKISNKNNSTNSEIQWNFSLSNVESWIRTSPINISENVRFFYEKILKI